MQFKYHSRFQSLSVLSHVLIFQHDSTYTSFEAPDMIDMYLSDAYKACAHAQYAFAGMGCECQEKIDIPSVLKNLENMAKFFAQYVIWINLDFEKNYTTGDSSPASSEDESSTYTLVTR